MKVAVIGRGRVGRGLFRWLREAGEDVVLVPGRARRRPVADVYILAVPDNAIAAVGATLSQVEDAVFLHCAGSIGVEAFGEYAESRDGFGALHPLVSFPPARSRARRTALDGGAYAFAIAGDRRAQHAARKLVRSMGGYVLKDAHGAPYHAAAAMVANGAAALAYGGIDILKRLGLSERKARYAVGALLRSVALNVEGVGLPKALTGPVARGDEDAVERHRASLLPEERAVYDLASAVILPAARRAGLSSKIAARIERRLRAV